MQATAIHEDTFANLQDGAMGTCDPNILDDFRFGNQRGKRNAAKFKDLCADIKEHKGAHSAVCVQYNPDKPGRLELIYGHGRRDACIAENITSIPFIFRVVSEEQAFQIHLSENAIREGLSLVAKARSAQKYMSLWKADYEAVASKLTVTVKKLRQLLELNKCSEKVLQAITDGHITEGHAYILAPFEKEKQDKNLAVVIAEKWTVPMLRERAGKVKISLDKAIFDKTECQDCEFNSVHQRGLFESSDDEKCAKRDCFQAKTTAHLATQKAELTQKYGQILLLSESNKEDRTPVNAKIVGQAQFGQCMTCDDKIAVLNDQLGEHLGAVLPNQCTNNVCFSKCKATFDAEVKAQLAAQGKDAESATKEDVKSAKTQAVKSTKAVASGTLTNKAKENYETNLRQASATFYADDKRFAECVMCASVISQASYKDDVIKSHKFGDALVTVMSLTNEQRSSITQNAISTLLNTTETDADSYKITSTLIKCLTLDSEQSHAHVTAHWQPTKENLSIYTLDMFPALLKSAKFNETMNTKDENGFTKLCKLGKGKIIETITKTDHDWSWYAPKSLLKLITKQ
jgi:PRTRC genetic system ParB family protein